MALTALTAILALSLLTVASGCGDTDDSASRVYFVDGHVSPLGWRGTLEPVERKAVDSPLEAVQALLARPSPSERGEGLISAIPQGTRLVRLTVAGGTGMVRLSTRGPGGPPAWGRHVGGDGFYGTAQLVYTLTEFASIKRVVLIVNGKHCCISTHENKPLREPLARDLFTGWQGEPTPAS